jgi:hypothetical protein
MDGHRPAKQAFAKTYRRKKSSGRVEQGVVETPISLPPARGVWLERCKTLVSEHVADLGGSENISFSEKVLVKRCACLITELERREMLFSVAGCASDDSLLVYQTALNSLRRCFEALGISRRAKQLPTLDDFLAQRARSRSEPSTPSPSSEPEEIDE